MKKAWNIDRNNLILRIIVTYLGTRGTASVLINVTDKYAGLGLIVVMSALFLCCILYCFHIMASIAGLLKYAEVLV